MAERLVPISQSFSVEVDLENIPLEQVLQNLKCTLEGLSSTEAQERLKKNGHNKLKKNKKNKILKFLSFMKNPLSVVMGLTAIMAIGLTQFGNSEELHPEYYYFVGIMLLPIINSIINFIELDIACKAAAALMARLDPKAKVLRNGEWSEIDACELVLGDIIRFKLGDIIPADARLLLEGDPIKVDEYALCEEALPVTKNPGDAVYLGSTCVQGKAEAIVIATGVRTVLGKKDHSVETSTDIGHFQQVSTAIGIFCISFTVAGIFIVVIITYFIQEKRGYRELINNLLVLLIGGIPIAMPTVLSVTMAIGLHRLSQKGAVTKRMTTIEKMAEMDVLFSDKTCTLTLIEPKIVLERIEVFAEDVDKDMLLLMATRASGLQNPDHADVVFASKLKNPIEARDGIKEVHFLPFNPTDQRTTLTYIDGAEKMHRVSKGAPEQILNLVLDKSNIKHVQEKIDDYAKHGFRSVAVACQEVPAGTKDSLGGPWKFVGLIPLSDTPHPDSAETIKRAKNHGVRVKMITGDQWEIAKTIGRRLGLGTNMYLSSSLVGDVSASPDHSDDLIEKANGFAEVLPGHKYDLVKRSQARKHICGMTVSGVNDVQDFKAADIGIAVADSTDAARVASDIVLTEPGLSVIISAVLRSRAIIQVIKNYMIYAMSITIYFVLGFMFLTIFWKFDLPPFMALIIALLNNVTIMTISRDRVKPSPTPASLMFSEIFATGIVIGAYLALTTGIFFWVAFDTNLFEKHFPVTNFNVHHFNMSDKVVCDALKAQMSSAIFLQVSIISQALIFITRSMGWSFFQRTSLLLVASFFITQLIASVISSTVTWEVAGIKSIGWGWTGVIWLYNIPTCLLLYPIYLYIQYALGGKSWSKVGQFFCRCGFCVACTGWDIYTQFHL